MTATLLLVVSCEKLLEYWRIEIFYKKILHLENHQYLTHLGHLHIDHIGHWTAWLTCLSTDCVMLVVVSQPLDCGHISECTTTRLQMRVLSD